MSGQAQVETRGSPRTSFLLAVNGRAFLEHTRSGRRQEPRRASTRTLTSSPPHWPRKSLEVPRPRVGTECPERKQKQKVRGSPDAPQRPRRDTPRAPRPGPSFRVRPRLGRGPRFVPARAQPRAARAASPASGRRPTTRGRQLRAFSSWVASRSGDGYSQTTQAPQPRNPQVSFRRPERRPRLNRGPS